jgi:hypothetical protein
MSISHGLQVKILANSPLCFRLKGTREHSTARLLASIRSLLHKRAAAVHSDRRPASNRRSFVVISAYRDSRCIVVNPLIRPTECRDISTARGVYTQNPWTKAPERCPRVLCEVWLTKLSRQRRSRERPRTTPHPNLIQNNARALKTHINLNPYLSTRHSGQVCGFSRPGIYPRQALPG